MPIHHKTGEAQPETRKHGPRVALVTPYDGGNLGDAAIQDSMISNLRLRMPDVQFLGITLNGDNFVTQHGATVTFPLLASGLSSRNGFRGSSPQQPGAVAHPGAASEPRVRKTRNPVRWALASIPGLVPFLKKARTSVTAVGREIAHSYEGYRILRTQDVLLISGGGQLDEEYGGPWRLPFTIFKWTLLARLARIPCAMASIGAGKVTSPTSRRLVAMAARMCSYRSFREEKSRRIVAGIFPPAINDSVVPDLAFSMPESNLPASLGVIRTMARGRPVVALSPIAYGKPVNWPTPDRALHERYVQQLADILRRLSALGYFTVVVCSSLGDDESVIPEILERLDGETKHSLEGQIYFPAIKTWRDLVTVLRDADYLIASRLHGTILGFLSRTPVIAISFDPKVDWVMEDLKQTDYLLHIRDFTAEATLDALGRIKADRNAAIEHIVSYRKDIISSSASARQYDLLAGLALKHYQSHP